jgi:NifU-like protein involved in Fe-S cluster formation
MNIEEKEIIVSGEEKNSTGNEKIKIVLTILEEGIIKNAKFLAEECEEIELLGNKVINSIEGKGIDYALLLNIKGIAEETGCIPSGNLFYAEMAEKAIKKALGVYYTQKGIFEEEKSNCQCCNGCKN